MSGLKYFQKDGTISIEQSRFYFIQSQVVIKVDNTNETEHDMNKTLKHLVQLVSLNGQRRTLLENAYRKCEIAATQSTWTSVIGAVFKLVQGDQLFVGVSHSNSLLPDEINNYFSIHGVWNFWPWHVHKNTLYNEYK